MSTIDTEHFRNRLEEEQARLERAVGFLERENPGSLADELGEVNDSSVDNHLGDTATATATGTVTATPTVTPTPTPCEGRCTPTPRPRPSPAPRP